MRFCFVPLGHVLCGMLLSAIALANPEIPRPTVAFSGDQVMDMGVMVMKAKTYYDPGKMRTEMSDIPMLGEQVSINREDLGLMWTISPESKTYTETELTIDSKQMFSGMDVLEYSQVGTEKIDGYPTRKFKAIFKDQQGNKGGGYFWFTEHNIPIKMDMVFKVNGANQKMSMAMSNLKIGPQDAALFELPAGYEEGQTNILGKMFGGAMPTTGGKDDEDPTGGLTESAEDAAKQGTEDAVTDTIYEESKNAVTKGFKSIFGR